MEIEEGEQDSPERIVSGETTMVEVLEVPLEEAVTVTDVLEVTEAAEAEKVAEEAPAATVTEEGTVRAAELSEMEAARPAVGAAAAWITVQVAV